MNDDTVTINAVLPHLRAGNSRQALAALADAAAVSIGIHARLIQTPLLGQEARQSSGIGGGVALAHARLFGMTEPFVLFARLGRPVDFAAADNKLVDLALLLLSPESDGPLHLRRLARLTRLMRDDTLCGHLRGMEDPETLLTLLNDPVSRRLAA